MENIKLIFNFAGVIMYFISFVYATQNIYYNLVYQSCFSNVLQKIIYTKLFFNRMNFTFIEGLHGGTLVYLHEENHLFYHTNDRNGQNEYTCYETILPEEYCSTKGEKEKKLRCSAKIFINKENICRRNKMQHYNHPNHDLAFRDLKTLHEIKEKCRFLSEWCPISAHKISAKEIFMVELAK